MAINDILPGVTVEVTVNDLALREHQDHDLEEEDRTVTRYIEATSGQVFAIRLHLDPSFAFLSNCLVCEVSVDGGAVESPILREGKPRTRTSQGRTSECGKRVSKYRFTSLETGRDRMRKAQKQY